ncbi:MULTISPECIES: DUF4232 domain-containing protein [unclassified Streptomyces]|uniref:DUF4232 domain-containing protein n=1 Tax=unclassified Streptomyces TaxID=2593676 RepID=UPI002E142520|nr:MULTISPECIES: DUF4232 domain-containing protein [unclassified Streptomyces]WSR24062.1 DUF4232 domain-containing protein [Streptomyces sp. NBC_01205]
MSGNRRKALLVSAALVCGGMLMTACQDTDAAAGTAGAGAAAPQGSPSATSADKPVSPSGSPSAGDAKGSGTTGKGTNGGAGSGADSGNGGRKPVGQTCGANDISWSTRSESQAGGYILIIAKAKPGITCVMPAALPTVAFGSDGTQAGPAEQAVGKQITLSGSTTAYAGVNPKSTSANGGKELDSIIVAIGNDDPNPVSLPVGTITVDKPVVTNWHTSPKDAVPSH